MIKHMSKRTVVNGVNLHYVVAGEGPVVLGMRGWPQNQREFLPLIEKLAGQCRFIVPDLGAWRTATSRFRAMSRRRSLHSQRRSTFAS
jgi:pimeloyl-ACP methyl ester carboxylesterase